MSDHDRKGTHADTDGEGRQGHGPEGAQLNLFPSGLTRGQFEQLNGLVQTGADLSITELRSRASDHLARATAAHSTNRLVNLRLAKAIHDAIEAVADQWSVVATSARGWLAGAILYFAGSNDDEPDFDSPIGFEDDAEVLNACLRVAGLEELCIDPEEYDDA